MSNPDDLETLMASESIKHTSLQELARLVLAFDEVKSFGYNDDDYQEAINSMISFAKGVSQ